MKNKESAGRVGLRGARCNPGTPQGVVILCLRVRCDQAGSGIRRVRRPVALLVVAVAQKDIPGWWAWAADLAGNQLESVLYLRRKAAAGRSGFGDDRGEAEDEDEDEIEAALTSSLPLTARLECAAG